MKIELSQEEVKAAVGMYLKGLPEFSRKIELQTITGGIEDGVICDFSVPPSKPVKKVTKKPTNKTYERHA